MPGEATPHTPGFFRATRGRDALEVIRRSRNAFALAFIIAHRAWYRQGFNADGCKFGEAFLGDYDEYGMTRQEYRTALAQLCKWKFATTRTTNKGTVARLISTSLFEIIPLENNHQTNHRATIKQPPGNHQATTNRDQREQKSRGKRALWQLLRDEETLTKRIRQEAEGTNPDRPLIESLKAQRRQVRDEMKVQPPPEKS